MEAAHCSVHFRTKVRSGGALDGGVPWDQVALLVGLEVKVLPLGVRRDEVRAWAVCRHHGLPVALHVELHLRRHDAAVTPVFHQREVAARCACGVAPRACHPLFLLLGRADDVARLAYGGSGLAVSRAGQLKRRLVAGLGRLRALTLDARLFGLLV